MGVLDVFDAFVIEAIPRFMNVIANSLVVSTSIMQPCPELEIGARIEILYRPSIPDNVENWQVFNDDDQIVRFLKGTDEFEGDEPLI